MGSSVFLLRSFTIGVLILCCCGPVPVHSIESVRSGVFEQVELKKADYANDSSLKETAQRVSFNFSTENGYPALPSWLRLEQRTAQDQPFLYGTPGNLDKSAVIEIIGWDKRTYTTERKLETFVVIPNQDDFPWYQAEFLVMNMNLDQFLANNTKDEIQKIVRDHYWPADDLVVTLVESALSRGGRIPLPNSNKHEGVYIRVGSQESWLTSGANSTLQAGQRPSQDHFQSNGFEIDWSKFRWLDLHEYTSPAAQRQALLPKDKVVTAVAYSPREFDDSPRNFEDDYILVVVIPIVIILVFVVLLSIIMCCGREGRQKRDQQTPHINLTHHHNIQRSSLRLRELSKPKDNDAPQTPPSQDPTRPRRAQNDYERVPDEIEDDGTDGRNAPPPYRMPPGSGGGGAGAQQV